MLVSRFAVRAVDNPKPEPKQAFDRYSDAFIRRVFVLKRGGSPRKYEAFFDHLSI